MVQSLNVPYDRSVVTKNVAKNKLKLLRSGKLGEIPWLLHAFSTRQGGVSRAYGGNALNLGFTKQDSRAAVERNRELFLKELGAANGRKTWPLVSLRQIHSDLIHRVDHLPEHTPGSGRPGHGYTRASHCRADRRLSPHHSGGPKAARRSAFSMPAGAARSSVLSRKVSAKCGNTSAAIREI